MTCSKKLFLTGATGLIGKELWEPLTQAGFEVYALVIEDNLPQVPHIHWLKGNLFDPASIGQIMAQVKPEYLLNMAWCTVGDYLTADLNYQFLTAGINLLKYFKDNGGKRAVYAGTCFEYKFKDSPLKETDNLAPEKTVYTFCKNKLHEIAAYFCAQHHISFGYGRIFYVYGRNENKTRLTGMIIDKLSRGEEVIIKTANLQKDYMYAKDIAGAFTSFLNSPVEGSVNICTGQAISIKDFALEIGRQLGKTDLIVLKNEPSNQPPLLVGDNSRLQNEIGYKTQYSLQQAITDLLEKPN